jgi:head-tail adaptor
VKTTPAGKRDRMIRFERVTTTENDLGVEVPGDWALIQDAWAAVRFGTSAERRQASIENASQVATFRVLTTVALRGVTVEDRIVFEDSPWSITGIAAVGGAAREIEFTATVRKG